MKDEEWLGFGRRIEAHIAATEKELAALRDTLRAAGIQVRRQRIRVTKANGRCAEALSLCREAYPAPVTPVLAAQVLGISSEYAFDLLASLVADGTLERPRRGQYVAVVPYPSPP